MAFSESERLIVGPEAYRCEACNAVMHPGDHEHIDSPSDGPTLWTERTHADGSRFTASSNTHTAYDAAADTLPRWYAVEGTRHTLRPDGYTAVQEVPTFYLCANVQGITSADAAVRIAHDILGTTEETATLWAYAAEDVGR